jgi:zinc/manganese transport system substrate-binding protein/manganese/iron transport system substrate-binding protein
MLYYKRGRRGGLIVALAGLMALVSGCGDSATPSVPPDGTGTPPAGGHVLHVTVTTTQIRSMADAVAGNAAKVTPILQASDDPHAYEPKPSDVQLIANADLVLRHGMGLDHWLDKVVQNAGGNHPVVTVTGGVKVESGAGEESGPDPHVWFDVTNAMTMTRDIRDAMIAADRRTKTPTRPTPTHILPCLSNSTATSCARSRPSRPTSARWSPTTTPSATISGATA